DQQLHVGGGGLAGLVGSGHGAGLLDFQHALGHVGEADGREVLLGGRGAPVGLVEHARGAEAAGLVDGGLLGELEENVDGVGVGGAVGADLAQQELGGVGG